MRTKSEVIGELKQMLRDVFAAKNAGESYARLARAHGYVDGYMRALIEVGFISREELLVIVGSEREHESGPAIRTLGDVDDSTCAA